MSSASAIVPLTMDTLDRILLIFFLIASCPGTGIDTPRGLERRCTRRRVFGRVHRAGARARHILPVG